jgi:DNA replication protein DnaC
MARRNAAAPYCSSSFISWAVCAPADSPCAKAFHSTPGGRLEQAVPESKTLLDLFRSAAALLEELHRQSPEGRRRKLRGYANVGLLCIDEVGYLSFDDKAADLLYEVINRRYERKPVILTTNRPFKEWNEVFPNATCIVTLLDRLLHHADVTAIEGESYRVRESEQETAARRRKK